MKFLAFNIAVAAALVFLFTANRGEVELAAGRLHDAAGEAKAIAERAVDRGRALLDENANSVPQARSAVVAPVKPPSTPSSPPPPVAEPEYHPAPIPEPPVTTATTAAPPPKPALSPEVARRRAEVLGGADSAAPAPAPRPGKQLMTAEQRHRELMLLSEEMELLYARKVSR